jgi:RNA polymerase sigma-70 factor (ECF subfamily)
MNPKGAGPREDSEILSHLLQRISRQDSRAFTELYRSTRAKMRRTALTVCGSSPDIDDILQIAYVKIWRNSAQFDPKLASPITWMCAILRNTAIDLIRVKKLPEATMEEALAIPNPPDTSSDDPFDYEAAAPIAMEALGKLPEDRRMLIVLAYLKGESRLVLSRRFGVPVGTIKTWLHRTLILLREDCAAAAPLAL